MDKQDFTATIWVEQSPQEVFDAAKNFRDMVVRRN